MYVCKTESVHIHLYTHFDLLIVSINVDAGLFFTIKAGVRLPKNFFFKKKEAYK